MAGCQNGRRTPAAAAEAGRLGADEGRRMQTQTGNGIGGLIDYRELREQLPNAEDDALATEFNTGRIVALVEDAGIYEERRLPMAYDAEQDAWRIDRAEARQGRFLFRQGEVDELATRHPEWLPRPRQTQAQAMQRLVQTVPAVVALEQERRRLEAELALAVDELAKQRREVEGARALVAETVKLRQYQAWSEDAIAAMNEAMEAQKSRIDELEAMLAEAKASACIGEGLPRIACDLRRSGVDFETATAELYRCKYKPSYAVAFSLAADSERLEATFDATADRNTLNARRGSLGQKATKRAAEASGRQEVDHGTPEVDRDGEKVDHEQEKVDQR